MNFSSSFNSFSASCLLSSMSLRSLDIFIGEIYVSLKEFWENVIIVEIEIYSFY